MKKILLSVSFLLFLGACSQKSTSSVSSNTENKTSDSEKSEVVSTKKASILNDLSEKFSGQYDSNGKSYLYSLEKEKEFPDRYDLVIQVFVKGKDSGTHSTVYKSYINYIQSADELKVQVHYAVKPNAYSWKHFPSSYTESTFGLVNRQITYQQTGEGWKSIKANGKITQKNFSSDKLSIKNAFDTMVKYYIDNYSQTFHK